MADIIAMPPDAPARAAGERSEISDRLLSRRLLTSRILAATMLVPGLPIIGVLMILVRLTSRGPSLYVQQRVGLRGQVFPLYKIRTMRVGAEAKTGAVWAVAGDPRVTWLGRILRRLHLDELPQLLNVLRGEMCLVGPRPERPEFVEKLTGWFPRYRERLDVHPGITGLAQVQAPPDSDLASVRRKLAMDLAYVASLSERRFLDMAILIATALAVLSVPASVISGVFGFGRLPQVDIPAPVQTVQRPRRAA